VGGPEAQPDQSFRRDFSVVRKILRCLKTLHRIHRVSAPHAIDFTLVEAAVGKRLLDLLVAIRCWGGLITWSMRHSGIAPMLARSMRRLGGRGRGAFGGGGRRLGFGGGFGGSFRRGCSFRTRGCLGACRCFCACCRLRRGVSGRGGSRFLRGLCDRRGSEYGATD
jgi:hypothetical protein